jgi:hypothetical protein
MEVLISLIFIIVKFLSKLKIDDEVGLVDC